jgi:6-pyruvoyltetrahydropterin/6-carboxytetrahydropterin synthase
MPIIRISKEFNFEMAHVLYGHKGACKNIHGHSYQLTVTLIGNTLNQPGESSDGMVMDFSDLKKIIQEEVLEKFDHALVLNADSPHSELNLNGIADKLILLPFQPTCENMLTDFANRISKRLPSKISLHSLRLRETATSYAEWFAEDN